MTQGQSVRAARRGTIETRADAFELLRWVAQELLDAHSQPTETTYRVAVTIEFHEQESE